MSTQSWPIALNGYSVNVVTKGIFGFTTFIPTVERNGNTYYSLKHESEYSITMTNSNRTKCDASVFIDGENMGTWRVDPYSSITIDRPVSTARKFTFVKEKSSEAEMGGVSAGKSENGLVKVVFTPEDLQEYIRSTSFDRFANSRHIDPNRVTGFGCPSLNTLDAGFGSTQFGAGSGALCGATNAGFGCATTTLFGATNAGFGGATTTNFGSIQNDCEQLQQQSGVFKRDNSSKRGGMFGFGSAQPTQKLKTGATVLGNESNQKFGNAKSISSYGPPTTIHLRLVVAEPEPPRQKYVSIKQPASNSVPPRID